MPVFRNNDPTNENSEEIYNLREDDPEDAPQVVLSGELKEELA